MTTNQINYFKAKLDEAHYARSDAENQRHNYAVEQISREVNEETRRANMAREAEQHRSNVANETNYYANLVEQSRHNQVTEALSGESVNIQRERSMYQNLVDTSSANLNDARVLNTQAETTLTGYKTVAQDTSNKQQQLNYNLDVSYAEMDRVTQPISNVSVLGVNVGGIGRALANVVTAFRSKTPEPSYQTQKKAYFNLNTK